jgi:hypothetical protein
VHVPQPVLVRGMRGLGDNLYQRAFIGSLPGPVYLDTPWPELYADMPGLRLVKAHTHLRTQRKNVERNRNCKWWPVSTRIPTIKPRYGAEGIAAGMTQAFGVAPGLLTLPPLDRNPLGELGRYVLVRPVTVRAEWPNEARNPLPEYVARAAARARRAGYLIVSVADLQPGEEWALDPLPVADVTFHAGELSVKSLLAVARGASAIIGGVGWIVPFAIASGRPALIVCGGQGGYNAPNLLVDGWPNDCSRIEFAVPENFCNCREKKHDCDKRINTDQLDAMLDRVLCHA